MNKGITLSRLFALSFLLLMTFCCKKEAQEIEPTASMSELSIQEAKQWFDTYNITVSPNIIGNERLGVENQVKREPVWKSVINHKFSKGNVLEIPLKYEKQTGSVMNATKIAPIKNYSNKQGKNYQRLLSCLLVKIKRGNLNFGL